MTTDTDRGYVSLLGTILEVRDDDFWLHFGLVPPGKKLCVDCGKLIPERDKRSNLTGSYCAECYQVRRYVILECGQCGKVFELRKTRYTIRLRRRKLFLFFCSKRCFGRYVGLKYGPKRKYDYGAIQELWVETEWTTTKIAAHLDIPREAASKALLVFQKYRQYRKRKKHG